MKEINITQVYINNLLNIFLTTIFMSGYLVLMLVFTNYWVWTMIACIIFAAGMATQIYPIYISCKMLPDLRKKETCQVEANVEEITPSFGWSFSGFTVRRRYFINLFTSDFWHIFTVKLGGNEKLNLQFYILASQLEKTGFDSYFQIYRSFKNIMINKLVMAPQAKVEYYKHSKIVKKIDFFT